MRERKYFEAARQLRRAGRLNEGAGYYTSSAFGYLMRFRGLGDDGIEEISPTNFGYFGRNLFLGALCYRIAGSVERCRTASEMGVLAVTDVRDNEPAFLEPVSEPPTGLCHELIGDFRLVGDLGTAAEAYRAAERSYEATDDPHQWAVEPEFELLAITMLELAESAGVELADEERGSIRYHSLVDRIRFKRDHFETIVTNVEEAGNW